MAYWTPFANADEAKAAFEAFVQPHGGVDSQMAMNAYCNAFSVETHDEYEDDLQRWTVALGTARDYVDQGVSSF